MTRQLVSGVASQGIPSRDMQYIERTRLPHRETLEVNCPAVACLCGQPLFLMSFWGSRCHAAWQAQISARAVQSACQQRWIGRDVNELMLASLTRGNCIFACHLELKALPQPFGSQREISQLQLCATRQEMKTSAFGWAKRHGQLLVRVVQAATLAHAAAAERFDVTTHKPLSKGTFSKAAVASRSLHTANSNETPIQSLLELSQQLFREIHLEVPRPAFAHAMRCVPQACRRGSGLKVSLSCSFVRFSGAADRMAHRTALPLGHLPWAGVKTLRAI